MRLWEINVILWEKNGLQSLWEIKAYGKLILWEEFSYGKINVILWEKMLCVYKIWTYLYLN